MARYWRWPGLRYTKPDDVARGVEETQKTFGTIDILVNNSGASWGTLPEDMPLERFERVMDSNVKGTFMVPQAVGKTTIARGKEDHRHYRLRCWSRRWQPQISQAKFSSSLEVLLPSKKGEFYHDR